MLQFVIMLGYGLGVVVVLNGGKCGCRCRYCKKFEGGGVAELLLAEDGMGHWGLKLAGDEVSEAVPSAPPATADAQLACCLLVVSKVPRA